MSATFLSLHVLAAILTVGPVAVVSSIFPRAAREAYVDPAAIGEPKMLHRITRVYAVLSITVPALGLATGAAMDVLGEPWLVVAMALTACAGALLLLQIVPEQERILKILRNQEPDPRADEIPGAGRLAGATGMFNLLWVIVVVLMVVRPGSTTGVGL